MDKFVLLLEEFILKAVTLTESVLEREVDADKLDSFTANRERLFLVIDQISRQVNWAEVPEERRTEVNRQIDYIKKLDEKLMVKLQEYQIELRKDIEKTHRNHETIKGYNLNDVK
ncbi:MAG: hypothetical protein V4598_15355 [Bdellovibrionota bacterium]